MLGSRGRALLLMGVGVLLVLSPLYLYPGSPQERATYRYEAERVEDEDLSRHFDADRVRLCYAGYYRSCLLERRVVASGGTLRAPAPGAASATADYEFVRLPDDGGVELPSDDYYRVETTVENGTLVLHTEPTSRERVVAANAVPASDLPPVVRRALEEGSATTSERLPTAEDRLDRLVAADGAYYHVRVSTEYRDRPFPVDLVRAFGVPAGLGLLLYGRGRHVRAGLADDDDRSRTGDGEGTTTDDRRSKGRGRRGGGGDR